MGTASIAHPVRVLVVDDHEIVREGLTVLLERHPDLTVIGSAGSGTEAVLAATRLEPDVIVMDLVLPELSGMDATARILARLPRTRVVILSMCRTSEHVHNALRAGALGYVLKESAACDLVSAVRAVNEGTRYLSPQVAAFAGQSPERSPARSPLERLSAREREVLHLTVAGNTSSQMGAALHLSPKTVETYRSRIMKKLGVSDRTELIRFAMQHAMTPP